jgi:hypothetical protein
MDALILWLSPVALDSPTDVFAKDHLLALIAARIDGSSLPFEHKGQTAAQLEILPFGRGSALFPGAGSVSIASSA